MKAKEGAIRGNGGKKECQENDEGYPFGTKLTWRPPEEGGTGPKIWSKEKESED